MLLFATMDQSTQTEDELLLPLLLQLQHKLSLSPSSQSQQLEPEEASALSDDDEDLTISPSSSSLHEYVAKASRLFASTFGGADRASQPIPDDEADCASYGYDDVPIMAKSSVKNFARRVFQMATQLARKRGQKSTTEEPEQASNVSSMTANDEQHDLQMSPVDMPRDENEDFTYVYDSFDDRLQPAVAALAAKFASAINVSASTPAADDEDIEPEISVAPPDNPAEYIEDYVDQVTHYSSQYGVNSYSAANLKGPPSIYPRYGDFTSAMVLRTYGPWWLRAPSAAPALDTRLELFLLTDFVEIKFPRPMFPTSIHIYETYNPGSIVRILCSPFNPTPDLPSWFELWSGPPQSHFLELESRDFFPPLRSPPFSTNILRLEFDHSNLGYYAELDAVLLCGNASHAEKIQHQKRPSKPKSIALLRESPPNSSSENSLGLFDRLPNEIIVRIFEYLDFLDLLNVSNVSRRFYALSYHAHLGFSALNLQRYWHKVTDAFLENIQPRCNSLQS